MVFGKFYAGVEFQAWQIQSACAGFGDLDQLAGQTLAAHRMIDGELSDVKAFRFWSEKDAGNRRIADGPNLTCFAMF